LTGSVVNDIDLQIQAEVYGLIGPNGAGKTTLIRCWRQLRSQPLVRFISMVIACYDKSNSTLKRRLGYLLDDFPLYEDLTVLPAYFARLYRLRDPRRSQRLRKFWNWCS